MIRSRRLVRCSGCGLAPVLCMCSELPSIATRTTVAIVIHKIELPKTSNTGRLVLGICPRSTCHVRGRIDEPPAKVPSRRLVLFPSPSSRPLNAGDASDDLTLVVPDGTWSQARRMVKRDPLVGNAELVHLPAPLPASRYNLRRNVEAERLCTFEAVAVALGILEDPQIPAQMLAIMDTFCARVMQMRREGSRIREASRHLPIV